MKKIPRIALLFAALFFCTYFSGCSDSSSDDDDTYFVEAGRITNSTYQSVHSWIMSQEQYCYDYNDVYNLLKQGRYKLKEATVGDYAYETGVDIDEIQEEFQKHFDNPLDLSDSINFLKDVGNTILFFYASDSDSHKFWMYIQKE